MTLFDFTGRQTTGEEGRFEFRDVPTEGVVVNVAGEGIVPDRMPLAELGAPESLSVRVHQRCSFEVVVKTPDLGADSISLHDAEGRIVDILRIDLENVGAETLWRLTQGRSGIVSASSAAATLDVLREGIVLKSLPVELRAGEVTRIEI